MANDEEKKYLAIAKKQSVFDKIKKFLKGVFSTKKEITYNTVISQDLKEDVIQSKNKSDFYDTIKIVEDEETKLLKLQKQYRSGKIKEKEMSQEQITKLCSLYDNQIKRLKQSNENRKQKLLLYKRKMQAENL